MVLPSPTSSARMTPRDRGERKANSAASRWWGFRSTVAPSSEGPSLAILSEALRLVNSCT